MIRPTRSTGCAPPASRQNAGFALVTCLVLLTVFAIVAVAGFTAALAELRIASSLTERERAFQAAEYGIEHALATSALATSLTPAAPLRVPAAGSLPVPQAAAGDAYAYRVYFAGATPSGLPPPHPAAPLTAFHFVIETTGYSARGASSRQVQSFKVLRAATWTDGPARFACDPADAGCIALPIPDPLRTAWLEAEAE
jgi:type II secretory pathway pseudopilin PulG